MSLMSMSMNATRILGPALAGVLIIFVGTSGVFFLISGVYALTVLTMLPIRVGREGQKRSREEHVRRHLGRLIVCQKLITPAGADYHGVHSDIVRMSLYALMPAWARRDAGRAVRQPRRTLCRHGYRRADRVTGACKHSQIQPSGTSASFELRRLGDSACGGREDGLVQRSHADAVFSWAS